MRRGFLGGTFNPPHWGHVRAAQAAAEQLGLEELIIIPAGTPPHKTLPAGSADGPQRLEMVRLAFGDIPGVRFLDWELTRPGRSYTAAGSADYVAVPVYIFRCQYSSHGCHQYCRRQTAHT